MDSIPQPATIYACSGLIVLWIGALAFILRRARWNKQNDELAQHEALEQAKRRSVLNGEIEDGIRRAREFNEAFKREFEDHE